MARDEARQVVRGQVMRGFENVLMHLDFIPNALDTPGVL